MVAQQLDKVGAAGLTLGGIGQHDNVQKRSRCPGCLRRAGMNFVVQRHALRVVEQLGDGGRWLGQMHGTIKKDTGARTRDCAVSRDMARFTGVRGTAQLSPWTGCSAGALVRRGCGAC